MWRLRAVTEGLLRRAVSWFKPQTREGRNAQRKLRGGGLNAISVACLISGLVGPYINPMLADALNLHIRALLMLGGVVAHLIALYLVHDMEDR